MEAQDSGVGLQVKRSELKTWLGNCVVFLGNSRVHRAQPYNYTKQQQPFKPKKFGCTTVQGATLTCMVNCTAGTPMPWLCPVVQWSVHWAPSQTTHVLVMARARRCTLEACGKKKCKLHFQAWLNLYIILYSYSTFLYPGVQVGTSKLSGKPEEPCNELAFHQGGE